jgi:hypothetical protein
MKIRLNRKLIGIASALAITLFITNPEIFALSYVIGSMGFDVFLLFLSFQMKDQIEYVVNLIATVFTKKEKKHDCKD